MMGEKDPLGYSGTPLARKLGLRSGMKVKLYHVPDDYQGFFDDLPDDIDPIQGEGIDLDFIHYFAGSAEQLEADLPQLRNRLKQDGMIWISWPKKVSKAATDLDGNIVRGLGLRHGLVDIKVCSVNEVWSALKFVIPVKDRK